MGIFFAGHKGPEDARMDLEKVEKKSLVQFRLLVPDPGSTNAQTRFCRWSLLFHFRGQRGAEVPSVPSATCVQQRSNTAVVAVNFRKSHGRITRNAIIHQKWIDHPKQSSSEQGQNSYTVASSSSDGVSVGASTAASAVSSVGSARTVAAVSLTVSPASSEIRSVTLSLSPVALPPSVDAVDRMGTSLSVASPNLGTARTMGAVAVAGAAVASADPMNDPMPWTVALTRPPASPPATLLPLERRPENIRMDEPEDEVARSSGTNAGVAHLHVEYLGPSTVP